MPRIDPQQLLNTLGALLSPNGSIKSPEEADRLVKLMNKFSRKLVSKCIYVQILRATPRDLLGKFLEEGGWKLLNTWFDDAIKALNWPLVTELLHLFLACPVTASLLKDNAAEHQAPKLINQLRSQANSNISATVKNLAGEIYKKWVSVVSSGSPSSALKSSASTESTSSDNGSLSLLQTLATEVSESLKKETSSVLQNRKVPTVQKPKSTIIDGSIKINKKNLPSSHPLKLPKSAESKESQEKRKRSSTDSKSDKERKKFRPDHRDECKPEEKQRIKDMARKLKEEAEKAKKSSAEKSSILSKIPKIPKKAPSLDKDGGKKSAAAANKSFEEMLGGLDSKPKTVKTPLAKNKTAQLLEGMKVSSSSSASKSSKSSSSSSSKKSHHHDSKKDHHHSKSSKSSEKKLTSLVMPSSSGYSSDKNSPKSAKSPTSASISESSSFMDSLLSDMGHRARKSNSKRRNSESENSKSTPPKVAKKESKTSEDVKKDSDDEKKESPTAAPQTFSFYKDTLETKEEEPLEKKETESNEDAKVEQDTKDDSNEESEEKCQEDLAFEEPESMPREVKGILVYHRGREKRDKKITWRAESDLVEVQYFEVDENERVNVNKLKFENMREMESRLEKEAVKNKSSMSDHEDSAHLLDWYKPVRLIVDNREPFVPGAKSKEKEVQAHREKGVLQALYFNREMTPNDPAEAEPEMIKTNLQPSMIPLEDQENDGSNSDHSYQNNGWPEPKENQVSQQASLESQFSLPPALSSLLSSINKNGLEAIIPPPTALSKEEQDTLAAQTEAMKKLGILPQGVAPPAGLNEPPPNIRPDFQRFPPPMNGGGGPLNNPAWSQFNGPPPNGGPGPDFNNHGFNHPPRFNGGFSRNGRGYNNQNHGYRTNGGQQQNNRGGYYR